MGPHDHLCWPFDDRAEFLRLLADFLSAGLAQGLKVVYAAEGSPESMRADLAAIPRLEEEIARGALELAALGDLYEAGAPLDPEHTLETFADATETALADGFLGLRAAADSTSLVQSDAQLDAFVAWEHLADRYMATHSFSGMCAFDRGKVSPRGISLLSCMHPQVREGTTLFRLFVPGTDADIALAGEIDATVTDLFEECLSRIGRPGPRELVVEATGLEFVDHRALVALGGLARRCGTSAVLRTTSGVPAKLIEILDLEGIRAEPVEAVMSA
jgi:anti-anti-sigma regulatory factor